LRLGPELPFDPGWEVVQDDLYHISDRVKEYDSDAVLVRESGSGRLGIGRFNRLTDLVPGGYVMLAAVCMDPETKAPLDKAPDGRVLQFMRIADGHNRIRDINGWIRKRRDLLAAQREAQKAPMREWSRSMAHEAMWRRSRIDLGRRPFAVINKEIH
jgi:hypothetical protein